MKNVVLILVSMLIVWVVWNMIKGLLFAGLGIVFQLAIIALFCFAVYSVYKALNRQKIL